MSKRNVYGILVEEIFVVGSGDLCRCSSVIPVLLSVSWYIIAKDVNPAGVEWITFRQCMVGVGHMWWVSRFSSLLCSSWAESKIWTIIQLTIPSRNRFRVRQVQKVVLQVRCLHQNYITINNVANRLIENISSMYWINCNCGRKPTWSSKVTA
jgi:hypothetical protein